MKKQRSALPEEEKAEEYEPDFNRDRAEEEGRESYIITVFGKKQRKLNYLDKALDHEGEDVPKKYTVVVENGEFKGLPSQIQDQLDKSGISKKQIQDHPEEVL